MIAIKGHVGMGDSVVQTYVQRMTRNWLENTFKSREKTFANPD